MPAVLVIAMVLYLAYCNGYKCDTETIKVVKPEESLAQKLANHLDANVYAYLKRSIYTTSWLDAGISHIQKIILQ